MPHADQWDHDENLPREIFSKAGEIGMMGMVAPKEYGGGGMSNVTAALAIKELGKAYAALSMDIAAHNALAVGQINRFGTDEQKKKYLPRLTSGEWIGAWALTEPNAGSDTGGIETRASEHERRLADQRAEEIHHQRPDRRSRRGHGHDRPDRQGQERDQRFHFDERSGHAGAKNSHLRDAGERHGRAAFRELDGRNC